MTMIEVSSNDLISLERDFKKVRDKLNNLTKILENEYKEVEERDLYNDGFLAMKGHIQSIYESLEDAEKNIYGFDEELGYLEEAFTNRFDDMPVPKIKEPGDLTFDIRIPEIKEPPTPPPTPTREPPKPIPTGPNVDKDVNVEVDKVRLDDITKKRYPGGSTPPSYPSEAPVQHEDLVTQSDTLNELLENSKNQMEKESVTSSINTSASNIVGGEL